MIELTIPTTILFILMLIALGFYLRKRMILELILAFLVSLSWVLFYGYNYQGTQIFLLGKVNLFALVAWTLGLVVLAQVYGFFKQVYAPPYESLKAIGITGVIYWFAVLAGEWFGYNILKIQLASSYHGLFGLELMHGPWWLKVYYLTVWLIFIGLLELTKYAAQKWES